MTIKTRIELSSLASPTHMQSGVASYTRLLAEALARNDSISMTGVFFNFLNRQPHPELSVSQKSLSKNSLVPLRMYAKAQSYGLAPPFDIFLPAADLTIFPNFATWPTVKSKRRATVVHDLTYLYHPEVVEEKNLAHLRRVVPRSIEQADFIITVSESVKAELIKEFNLNPEHCVVTPIPPSADFYQKSNKEVHGKYGIPTKKYIYFIGNLEPRKNLSTLLEAYLELPDTVRKEYSLILAGSKGWKNESLQAALSEAEKSGENVRHIGFIDQADSPALYQNASLFVMPSLYEGFGMPILESMASGTPVVASDIPVFREIGSTYITYADPHNTQSFSKAILETLRKPCPTIKNLQENARRYKWDDNVSRIIAAFQSLQ